MKKITQTSSNKAFTLIELLVVISIIGLLSSVVLVSLQGARVKAVNARIIQETGQLRNSFELGRTNAGYTGLSSSGSSGIAAYGSMSTEMQGLVNDILKQQGRTIATSGAYPGGSAACGGALTQANTEGVIVTTEATACGTTPTGYAIYAANSPVGTAGYTCIDSKGGRGSATSGGIVLNSTAGVCPGTVSGGGGGGGGAPVISLYINSVLYSSGSTVYLNYGQGETEFELEWLASGTGISGCNWGDSSGNNNGSGSSGGNASIPVQGPGAFESPDTISVDCTNAAGTTYSSLTVQVYP